VYRTIVGYTGGEKLNPTYHDLGDHTESIEIHYNPAEISFEQLLQIYWSDIDPHYSTSSIQYRNVIWANSPEQRQAAEASAAALENASGQPVATKILDGVTFYPAEDYHQKYGLRQNRALMAVFDSWYPDGTDFRNSFTAMRMNAYVQGHGSAELVQSELEGYALPPDVADMLQAQSSMLRDDAGAACMVPGA